MINVRGMLISFLHSFRIFVGRLFGPLALLLFRELILSSTSFGLIGFRKNISGEGFPKYYLKSFLDCFILLSIFWGISTKNLFIVSAIFFLLEMILSLIFGVVILCLALDGFVLITDLIPCQTLRRFVLFSIKKTIVMIGFAESCEFCNLVFICFICIAQFFFPNWIFSSPHFFVYYIFNLDRFSKSLRYPGLIFLKYFLFREVF